MSKRASTTRRLRANLLLILLARTLVNTAYRAPVPFLPFITRDLGISLQAGGVVLTIRNLVGLSAPFLGPLSDRYGRVPLMMAGLGLMGTSALTIGVAPTVLLVGLALVGMTLGKSMYDPAMQAYLGDEVPYAERGRAIALAEVSWSGAGLIGLPIAGVLVSLAGWRSPFVLLGVLVLGAMFLTWRVFDSSSPQTLAPGETAFFSRLRLFAGQPGVLAALATSFLMDFANENVNIVYGAWLNDRFNLDAAAIGGIASLIGVAELGGELLSSGLVDRLGKRRTVVGGLVLTGVLTLALPWFGLAVWGAAVGLFLMFLAFEFSLVSSLALITELAPQARGALISVNVAAFLLGRSAGSLSGPFVYTQGGFLWSSIVAAAITFLAAGVWGLLGHERKT